jgi:hypothetical protein
LDLGRVAELRAGVTNRAPATSPAMAIGIEEKRWRMGEICAWNVLFGD